MKDNSTPDARTLIRLALREDMGARGDVTTRCFVPKGARLEGRVIAKKPGVICGAAIAARVFRLVEPGCRVRVLIKDGGRVKKGTAVMSIAGGRKILTAERTALNFLQHLSGVATLTALYADKAKGTAVQIFDTRKTLPGWRALQKYAVRCGGGVNHRMGLYDAALLKDNHWAWNADIAASARAFRERYPRLPLEIEAASLAQVRRALTARPDAVLLDNMGPARLKAAIGLIRRQAPGVQIEVSGGVSLANVRALARLGPDRVSIGRLTHSAPALDLSLEIRRTA